MECSEEEKEARKKMQLDAQKLLAQKMADDKAARLKELEDAKQAKMLKEAKSKK